MVLLPATLCNALEGLDSTAGENMVTAIEQSDLNDDEGSDNTTVSLKRRLQCQVEGCIADLTSEKAYCIKRRLCNEHMRADAVTCRAQPGLWRFCFQCGKLEPLSSFEGNKRSCRTRLAQRKQRETRRCHSDINYRCSRGSSRLPPIGPGSKCSKAPGRHGRAALQPGLLQDMHEELHTGLQQPEGGTHPAATSAAGGAASSPFELQQQQSQHLRLLPLVSEKEEEFPGFAATQFPGTCATDVLASFSSSNSLQYSMQYSQQRSPTPSLPAVPEGATAADVYTPRVTQQQHQEEEVSIQQAGAAAMQPRHAPRRVSFAPAAAAPPAATDQHAASLPWFGGSSSCVQLPAVPAMSRMAGGCQSAPLPAVSEVSGVAARGAASAQRAASPPPAVGGGEVQSAEAASYYSKLLDDLLMEVRADAAVAPEGASGDGVMHLNGLLPVDDPLQQHTDADLRHMLETALEQAVVLEPLPKPKHKQLPQQHQQEMITAAEQDVWASTAEALKDRQQWQQAQQQVAGTSSAGAGSFSLIHTKLEAENHLLMPGYNMHSSGRLSQGWPPSYSNGTIAHGLQQAGNCAAPTALGSFAMSLPLGSTRVPCGFNSSAAGGPAPAAAASLRQQQQPQVGLLASHSEKLQQIRQKQQVLLQQMHSQVAVAHVIAADDKAMCGSGNNNPTAAPAVKLQQQTLEQQLNDMQDFINYLQMEMMDVDPTASVCC